MVLDSADEEIDAFWAGYVRPSQSSSVRVFNLKFKQGIASVPYFEFTVYIQDLLENGGQLSTSTFLDSLSNTAVQFTNNGNNSGVPSNGTITNTGSYNGSGTTKQAGGIGMAIAVAAIAGGMIYGVKKFA